MLEFGLYTNPRKLTLWSAAPRAHRLGSYPHLRNVTVVPVAHREIATLARSLPIAWTMRGDALQPLCLLGLAPGRSLAPSLGDADGAGVPLLLKAYPFGASGTGVDRAVYVDDAPADALGEGTPLISLDAQLSAIGTVKYQALQAYVGQEEETERIAITLQKLGAFRPWRLNLRFDDGAVPVDGLLGVDPGFMASGRLHEAMTRLSPLALAGLEAQLASRAHLVRLTSRLSRN